MDSSVGWSPGASAGDGSSLPHVRHRIMWPLDPDTPTTDVARWLLGAVLHRRLADGTHLSGRIVETEAYLGLDDAACHSFHGRRTPRVASMYLRAGHAYVYRIYGLHLCLNVVTGDEARPEAVLVRALAPLSGAARMRELRGRADDAARLCAGPARLTQALAIGVDLDGHRLDAPPLWLVPGAPVDDVDVEVGPRVGLSARVASRDWPLRFCVRGDPSVSRGPVGPRGSRGPERARAARRSRRPTRPREG